MKRLLAGVAQGRTAFELLAVVVSVGLLALMGTGDACAGPAQRVTLSVWCSPYPAEAGWAIEMVSRWNHLHPDIQVRLQKIPSERVAEDVLSEAIRDKKGPDVCVHMFPANVPDFVAAGGLMPLDDLTGLVAASTKRSGAERLAGLRSTDGRLYQIPWKCNPIMLQYNAGLLKQMHFAPPRTYGQFLAVADALHKRGVYALAADPTERWYARYYDFYPLYLAASGGQLLLDGGGKPIFDTAAAVGVLDFLGQLFRRGEAPTRELYKSAAALNEGFASGKIGFLVTGPWNAQLITELAGRTIQYGFVPIPVPDAYDLHGPVYTYGNFRNISIFSTCVHPREAAALVEFLISQPADVAFMEATSEMPDRLGLATAPAFAGVLKKYPYLAGFARQLAWVRPVQGVLHFDRVLGAISRAYVEVAVKGAKPAAQGIHQASEDVTRGMGSP